MKNYLLISLICVLLTSNSLAQEVISTAGTVNSANGIELTWTLGETVIATHSTDTQVLTQGFHQTKLIITAVNQLDLAGINVKVYPNPTSNYVVVQFDEDMPDAHIQLFDLAGKKLKESVVSNTSTQLKMTEYSEGTYLLKLFDAKFQPIQTFKIIKQ